jgi:hypothetical protein
MSNLVHWPAQSALQSGSYVNVNLVNTGNCGVPNVGCLLNSTASVLQNTQTSPLLSALAPVIPPF